MLTRQEIEDRLVDLEESLVPERLTRREAEALLVNRLSRALLLRPDDVAVSWEGGELNVRVPTRLHYFEHLDLIHERLDGIARRVVYDFSATTEDEFRDTMQRLRSKL